MTDALPILYSFRRCPYAMRARIALVNANIPVILREIDLQNKHPAFLQDSPKGTVPVLMFPNGGMIDESLDVVDYAFSTLQRNQNDVDSLLQKLNGSFIGAVNRFKYYDRLDGVDLNEERKKIEDYLKVLDELLEGSQYLLSDSLGKADAIVLPHVRQLYRSDEAYFKALPFEHVKRWLFAIIESPMFQVVMMRCPVWQPEQEPIVMKTP